MLSTINGPPDRLLFSKLRVRSNVQSCKCTQCNRCTENIATPFAWGKSSDSSFLRIRYVMEFSDGFPVCAQLCFISIKCNSLRGWVATLWIGCIMRFSRCAAHVFVGLKFWNINLRFSNRILYCIRIFRI